MKFFINNKIAIGLIIFAFISGMWFSGQDSIPQNNTHQNCGLWLNQLPENYLNQI